MVGYCRVCHRSAPACPFLLLHHWTWSFFMIFGINYFHFPYYLMILTPLWILVRFCRRRLFTPSFVCLFVCLSQLALREVSVMLYNIARQVLITSKNEDNFKNEDNLKTEDSLKMKKTSKLRRPQTLRLSIILKRLKNDDNLKMKMTSKRKTTWKIKMKIQRRGVLIGPTLQLLLF